MTERGYIIVLDRLTNLASSIQYPESNSLIASYAYAYEANRSLMTSIISQSAISNQQSEITNLFMYDPARQLIQEYGIVFRYDAAGRLIDEASSNVIHNYSSGNIQTWMQVVTNSGYANLNIRCDSPANIADWTVEANGVSAVSSNYAGTYTSFQITNVPLTTTCSWVTVKLDNRSATETSNDGWFDWGQHQPATNRQLHFTVEPASQSGAGVVPVTPTIYTYDAAGQLTSKTQSGRGVSPVSYAYDAARNLTRCWGNGFTNQYFYDHARRLIRVFRVFSGQTSSFTFVYDGLDIVAKVDNLTGHMIYFSRGLGIAPGVGDVLAESHLSSNGSLKYTYVYVQNHRGDTVALVSNSTVVARYEYSAWGQVASHTGADAWFTFSGKHYDVDMSLYYYGYRWYDPAAKRWTQPDPSGLAEGLDLYQFCQNDSINGVDGYGLDYYKQGNDDAMPSDPFLMAMYNSHFLVPNVDGRFRQTSFLADNALKIPMIVGTIAGGFVPGPGEIQDIMVLNDKNSGPWDIALAKCSLLLSVVSVGIGPNYGQLKQLGRIGNIATDTRRTVEGFEAGTTRLWRAVEYDELVDVLQYGDYNIHPNSTFKRFAYDEDSLDNFIRANANKTYTKTYIDVSNDKLPQMIQHEDIGGVGKAIGIDVYEHPEFYEWFDAVHIKE